MDVRPLGATKMSGLREATGVDMSAADLDRCAERAFILERALQIRYFGRSRQDDECIIPYLEPAENLVNPFIGRNMGLDRPQFLQLMDQYYDQRGWDRRTGWPTPARLTALGLTDVAETLASAASCQTTVTGAATYDREDCRGVRAAQGDGCAWCRSRVSARYASFSTGVRYGSTFWVGRQAAFRRFE
jgi:hypothetical protein